MVTADEVGRSLRGAAALIGRRSEAVSHFETASDGAFWRSFSAILLASPAFVVALALRRRELGIGAPGSSLFDAPDLVLGIAGLHLLAFVALPLLMIPLARRFGFGARYVPFVIVLNWLAAFAALALALPGTLLLLGWATPELAKLYGLAFGIVVLQAKWSAVKATLETGPVAATLVTLLAVGVAEAPWSLLYGFA